MVPMCTATSSSALPATIAPVQTCKALHDVKAEGTVRACMHGGEHRTFTAGPHFCAYFLPAALYRTSSARIASPGGGEAQLLAGGSRAGVRRVKAGAVAAILRTGRGRRCAFTRSAGMVRGCVEVVASKRRMSAHRARHLGLNGGLLPRVAGQADQFPLADAGAFSSAPRLRDTTTNRAVTPLPGRKASPRL